MDKKIPLAMFFSTLMLLTPLTTTVHSSDLESVYLKEEEINELEDLINEINDEDLRSDLLEFLDKDKIAVNDLLDIADYLVNNQPDGSDEEWNQDYINLAINIIRQIAVYILIIPIEAVYLYLQPLIDIVVSSVNIFYLIQEPFVHNSLVASFNENATILKNAIKKLPELPKTDEEKKERLEKSLNEAIKKCIRRSINFTIDATYEFMKPRLGYISKSAEAIHDSIVQTPDLINGLADAPEEFRVIFVDLPNEIKSVYDKKGNVKIVDVINLGIVIYEAYQAARGLQDTYKDFSRIATNLESLYGYYEGEIWNEPITVEGTLKNLENEITVSFKDESQTDSTTITMNNNGDFSINYHTDIKEKPASMHTINVVIDDGEKQKIIKDIGWSDGVIDLGLIDLKEDKKVKTKDITPRPIFNFINDLGNLFEKLLNLLPHGIF